MPEPTGTRRAQQRFHCTGGVEMRRSEGAPPVFGNLSDLSLTGCYVETVSTLPVGSEILFMLRVRDNVVRGRAQVKTSHHAVGARLGVHAIKQRRPAEAGIYPQRCFPDRLT